MGLPNANDGRPVKYLCTISPLCDGKCRERNTEHGEVCCSECYTEEEERRFRARQRRSEGRDKDRDE